MIYQIKKTFSRASSFFAFRSRFTLFMASLRLRDRPDRPMTICVFMNLSGY